MSEVRGIVIELKVADHTVLGEIFGDASFSDSEMVGELGLEGIGAATACATPQQIGDGDPESLASLNVIVGGEVRIAEQQNARACGSAVRRIQFHRGTTQEAAKLHLEEAEPGRKAGIAVASAQRGGDGLGGWLNRERGRGKGFANAAKSRFGSYVDRRRRLARRERRRFLRGR
jgi:hypothetical protein